MNNKGRPMVRIHPLSHIALETLLVKPCFVIRFNAVRLRTRAPQGQNMSDKDSKSNAVIELLTAFFEIIGEILSALS